MKSLYYLVLLAVFLASCSPGFSEEDLSRMIPVSTSGAIPIVPEMLTPYVSPQPTQTTSPTATVIAAATQPPKPTQVPTLIPSPIYSQPKVLAEFSGTGETVTDNYVFPQCFKAVYYWSASPNSNGKASLTLIYINQPQSIQ